MKWEDERAFQEWLRQQDSGCTCWERLTLTFRHDVWPSRVLLKAMSCSHFPGLVLHPGSVSGCVNWALFLVPQGWKYIRRTGGTSGLLVRGTRPELGLERQDTQKGAQGTQYRCGQCKLLSLAIIIACTQNHCCHRDLETGGWLRAEPARRALLEAAVPVGEMWLGLERAWHVVMFDFLPKHVAGVCWVSSWPWWSHLQGAMAN